MVVNTRSTQVIPSPLSDNGTLDTSGANSRSWRTRTPAPTTNPQPASENGEAFMSRFSDFMAAMQTSQTRKTESDDEDSYDLRVKVKPADVPTTTQLTSSSSFAEYLDWKEFMIAIVTQYVVMDRVEATRVWHREVLLSKRLTDFLEDLICKNVNATLRVELSRLDKPSFFAALSVHRTFASDPNTATLGTYRQMAMYMNSTTLHSGTFDDTVHKELTLVTGFIELLNVKLEPDQKDRLLHCIARSVALQTDPKVLSYTSSCKKESGADVFSVLGTMLAQNKRLSQPTLIEANNKRRIESDRQSHVSSSGPDMHRICYCSKCGLDHGWSRRLYCKAFNITCQCGIRGHVLKLCPTKGVPKSSESPTIDREHSRNRDSASAFQAHVEQLSQPIPRTPWGGTPHAFPANITMSKLQEVMRKSVPVKKGYITAIIDTCADTCITFNPELLCDKREIQGTARGMGTTQLTHQGTLQFCIGKQIVEDRLAVAAVTESSISIDLIISAPRLAALGLLETSLVRTTNRLGLDTSGQQLFEARQIVTFGSESLTLYPHQNGGASDLYYCYIPREAFPHLSAPGSTAVAMPTNILTGPTLNEDSSLSLAHRRVHKPLEICQQLIPDTVMETHCQYCLLGHNTSARTGKLALHPATYSGEKVHFDCFKTGLKSYPVAYIFVDSFSRYKQVYFTPKRQVENVAACTDLWLTHTRKFFPTLEFIADQAAEHEALKARLSTQRIKLRTRSSYSSILNGIAERAIRTTIEDAGTIFAASGLPPSTLPYVVKAVVYLNNILPGAKEAPASILQLPQPFKHLRVIGSRAYIHNFRRTKSMLDSRTVLGYLIGYSFDEHHIGCYTIWRPDTGRVLATRHVVFDERWQFLHDKAKLHQVNDPWLQIPEYIEDPPLTADPTEETSNTLEEATASMEALSLNSASTLEGTAQVAHLAFTSCSTIASPPLTCKNVNSPYANMTPYISLVACLASVPSNVSFHDIHGYPGLTEAVFDIQKLPILPTPQAPKSYKQMIASVDASQWRAATEREWRSLLDNHTFSVSLKSELSSTDKVFHPIWVWSRKRNGSYKARLVIDGSPEEATPLHYAPTLPTSLLLLFIAISASSSWDMFQMDVSTAFLHADLTVKNVYMSFPPGYFIPNHVLRLHKCLYGLREAPRQWAKLLFSKLKSLDWQQSSYHPCFFYRQNMLLICYVDDFLIAGNTLEITHMASSILQIFPGKLSESLTKCSLDFLSLHIQRTATAITVDQTEFINTQVSSFIPGSPQPKSTPLTTGTKYEGEIIDNLRKPFLEFLGTLLFVATHTRYDISYAVSCLASYSQHPTQEAYTGLKRVARYLLGTASRKLVYHINSSPTLDAFCDCGSPDEQTSRWTSGGVVRSGGTPITWFSQRQRIVVLSTCEGELVALCTLVQQLLWLRYIYLEVTNMTQMVCAVFCDNQSAILIGTTSLSKSQRTQHLHRRYRFTEEHVHKQRISIQYCATKMQLADILTKPLPIQQHHHILKLFDSGFIPTSNVSVSFSEVTQFLVMKNFNSPECSGFQYFTSKKVQG